MQRLYAAALLYVATLALSAGAGWKIARLQGKREEIGRPAATIDPVPRAVQTTAAARAPVQRALQTMPADRGPMSTGRRSVTAASDALQDLPGASLRQDGPQLSGTTAGDHAILILVSLPSQRAFVFRQGTLWDSSRVSTGKRGKPTPTGTFTILEKQVHHRSTKYDDAPMPYMQRLTWGGVALHVGHVPGYPASHGCIRLPLAFARRLYRVTDFGSTVVVVTARRVETPAEARKLS
jgi:lipoprotein-anchoring transpeptidase ErfK/SrfK